MELFDDDDFLIESSLECLLLSHCPSQASSEAASASSLSSSLAPPASSSDSLEKRRRHSEDADRVEFVSNTKLSNKDVNNSTSVATSSILEKAIALITQQNDVEEEKEEEIPHLDSFQKRVPFKSTSDISHQLSNSLTQKTGHRNQILVKEDKVEHLQDSSSICDFSDFEEFLFLDFSCLEDESEIYLSPRLVASISPPSIVKISDKLEEEVNQDLDSMAALFAFNASCTSPSCRTVYDYKRSSVDTESSPIHHKYLPTDVSENGSGPSSYTSFRSYSCSNTPAPVVSCHSPPRVSSSSSISSSCLQQQSVQQNSGQFSQHHQRHHGQQHHGYSNINSGHSPLPPSPPGQTYHSTGHHQPTGVFGGHSSFQPHHLPQSSTPNSQVYQSPHSPPYSSYYGSPGIAVGGTTVGGSTGLSSAAGSHMTCYPSENFASTPVGPPPFPTASVSVNLSMNMTMGFATPSQEAQQQSIQWSMPSPGYNSSSQGIAGVAASVAGNALNASGYGNHLQHHHTSYAHANQSDRLSCTSNLSSHGPQILDPVYTPLAQCSSPTESASLPPIDKEFPGVCSYPPSNQSYQHHSASSGSLGQRSSSRIASLGRLQRRSNRNTHDSHHHSNGVGLENMNLDNDNSSQERDLESVIAGDKQMSALSSNLCRICGKTYARPSTLKTHLRTHSGERPYRCDHCNKSFSQAANLTAHIRTHSGEKPFRCLVCDRRFSQSSSVTTHMRTHSGERPYRCKMCRKAFSDSSTLTKHLRIHSGEKPYQCKLCHLRFSQSGNLNRHMRIHSPLS